MDDTESESGAARNLGGLDDDDGITDVTDVTAQQGQSNAPEEGEEGNERDRRRQILDAAFEEFAEHGFRGATIKRIAQRARLRSQALIYWYFPAKEALFEAVLGQQLPPVQMVLDPAPLLDRPP